MRKRPAAAFAAPASLISPERLLDKLEQRLGKSLARPPAQKTADPSGIGSVQCELDLRAEVLHIVVVDNKLRIAGFPIAAITRSDHVATEQAGLIEDARRRVQAERS